MRRRGGRHRQGPERRPCSRGRVTVGFELAKRVFGTELDPDGDGQGRAGHGADGAAAHRGARVRRGGEAQRDEGAVLPPPRPLPAGVQGPGGQRRRHERQEGPHLGQGHAAHGPGRRRGRGHPEPARALRRAEPRDRGLHPLLRRSDGELQDLRGRQARARRHAVGRADERGVDRARGVGRAHARAAEGDRGGLVRGRAPGPGPGGGGRREGDRRAEGEGRAVPRLPRRREEALEGRQPRFLPTPRSSS